MISKENDLYNDADDESYNPAKDDDATDVTDIHDNKDNATIEEDTDPYPGVPAIIIGYGNGIDAEAIPAGVYHDANNANIILQDYAPSTGEHTPHIPVSWELQIIGLIPDTTYNT